MSCEPMKTDEEYCRALREIETLMAAEPGTPEGARLETLASQVEAYEEKHYPIDPPTPADLSAFRKDQSWP